MTGWDVLSNVITGFPPVALALLMAAAVAAVVTFIVGFSRHGMDFVKHGFKQNLLSELMEKLATKEDIAGLRNEFKADIAELRNEFKADIAGMQTELETIKVNHFGHLKNFLTELTSILQDKGVINNTDRARLENQLRGM